MLLLSVAHLKICIRRNKQTTFPGQKRRIQVYLHKNACYKAQLKTVDYMNITKTKLIRRRKDQIELSIQTSTCSATVPISANDLPLTWLI